MPELKHYLFREMILAEGLENYSVSSIEEGANPKSLGGLGRINIFVGANNSGKSRLVRGIARCSRIVFEPRGVKPFGQPFGRINTLKSYLHSIWRTDEEGTHFEQYLHNTRLHQSLDNFSKVEYPGLSATSKQGEPTAQRIVNMLADIVSIGTRNWSRFPQSRLATALQEIQSQVTEGVNYEQAASVAKRIYIPTLRTLRDLGKANEKVLQSRTAHDYEIDEQMVFTGQSLYSDVESLLRGNLTDREALRHFEEWLAKTFFENRPVAIIPRIGQTTLTVKIGDEPEKPIHELGDGIQALLILTFPLFRNENRHVLGFIEEPELFLHPWLQRAFLEMLSERFPKHQYFLTTHSNHFLDLTLDLPDVSVFALDKEIDKSSTSRERAVHFKIYPVSRDDRKPLELLGVRNSSVFLSNCTIWVEGITDRRYIAHWLKLYQERTVEGSPSPKAFKEDLHYSFVEYGGGNITHFSFLDDDDEGNGTGKSILVERLCAKLFLITDADGDKEDGQKPDKKSQRQEILKTRLGDNYCCLQGREIENLIKPEVLQEVLKAYGEIDPPLLSHADYLNKYLGRYIDTKLGEHRKRRSLYADESGTIKGKITFCDKAILATRSWSDVSESVENLIKRIHQFISSMNQG